MEIQLKILVSWRLVRVLISPVHLFTDTSAILNLLDLRSIMGCPGGTRSVFSRSFPAKREVQCIFLGKKAFVIKSKDGTTIFFSHFNLFVEKLKNWPESERKYWCEYNGSSLCPLGIPKYSLNPINSICMTTVSVKRSIRRWHSLFKESLLPLSLFINYGYICTWIRRSLQYYYYLKRQKNIYTKEIYCRKYTRTVLKIYYLPTPSPPLPLLMRLWKVSRKSV